MCSYRTEFHQSTNINILELIRSINYWVKFSTIYENKYSAQQDRDKTFIFQRSLFSEDLSNESEFLIYISIMGEDDKQYSLEEVESHNIGRGPDKSVWMVIHDKVYDVTKFLDEVSVHFM